MKRAFSTVLAVVLTFCAMLPASAAVAPPKKTVYVASQKVPKAAVDYVRNQFSNRIPTQDICDITGLTVEQAKKIRICPAFRAEYFERDGSKIYNFPLIYENTYVGMCLVHWDKWDGGAGYTYQLDGADNPFIGALNTMYSSAAAPLTFIWTDNGAFVLDSNNKATWLKSYPPYSEKEIERQTRDIPKKLQKPAKVVAVGTDTAYPESVSSAQIADELPVLTVKNETKKLIYKSEDGGKTWTKGVTPQVYMSIDKTVFSKNDEGIPYIVYNNTQTETWTDTYFDLRKWNGQKWVKCPGMDELMFNDVAFELRPKTSWKLNATINALKLDVGRYQLIKRLSVDDQQFTCETVFILE